MVRAWLAPDRCSLVDHNGVATTLSHVINEIEISRIQFFDAIDVLLDRGLLTRSSSGALQPVWLVTEAKKRDDAHRRNPNPARR